MQRQIRAGMARGGGGRGRRAAQIAALATAAWLSGPAAASAATATFTAATATVAEGHSGTTSTTLGFTVACGLLEFSSPTITIELAGASATSGTDFVATATPTSASFSCTAGLGGGGQVVTVSAKGDTLDELDESFSVKLTDGADTVYDTAAVTITDDDAPPVVSLGVPDAVVEGTGTDGPGLVFPVSLSAPSSRTVSVHYATADGSATAGADYTGTSGTLSIPAGQTSGTVTVPVSADAVDEDDETLSLTLSAPVNATAGAVIAQAGAITDDDTATLAVTGASVLEGAAGATTPTNAVINLSTASARTVTVFYGTVDGTATAKADYASVVGQATIAPGQRTALIPLSIVGDATVEPDEAFTVTIGGAAGAAIAADGASATVTIRNDDAAAPGTTPPGTTTPGTTTPDGGGSTSPGGSGTPAAAAPGIKLGRLSYRRAGGTMRFDVRCPETTGRCRGTVTVFSVPARRSKVKALRVEQQLGSKRFELTAGGTVTVTLRLSKKAKAWLRSAKSIRVAAYAVSRASAGGVTTAKVAGTLKR